MNPYRIELAKDMGVEAVIDPTRERALKEIVDLPNGKGAARRVECSSVDPASDFLVNAAPRRGQRLRHRVEEDP